MSDKMSDTFMPHAGSHGSGAIAVNSVRTSITAGLLRRQRRLERLAEVGRLLHGRTETVEHLREFLEAEVAELVQLLLLAAAIAVGGVDGALALAQGRRCC